MAAAWPRSDCRARLPLLGHGQTDAAEVLEHECPSAQSGRGDARACPGLRERHPPRQLRHECQVRASAARRQLALSSAVDRGLVPPGLDCDAAALWAGFERRLDVACVQGGEEPGQQAEVHVAHDAGMTLGDGVEEAVCAAAPQPRRGRRRRWLAAALAQQGLEIGRSPRLGGDLAAQRVRGIPQGAALFAVLVVRCGMGERLRAGVRRLPLRARATLERRAARRRHHLGGLVLRLTGRRQGPTVGCRPIRTCAVASRSPTPRSPTRASASASRTSTGSPRHAGAHPQPTAVGQHRH